MNRLKLSIIILTVFTLLSSSKSPKRYYNEVYRPQFHFSPEKNWINDPNGLLYHDGEYHLFYQYNPFGRYWGFMHWGHAVSNDLIHWEELPIAIYPDEDSKDELRCTAFSGSAIVDEFNLLGKQEGSEKTLVIFYTSKMCGQRIAYSIDRGRSWIKYENNPIIDFNEEDDARDPKVLWHEQSQKYVMVLYRKESSEEDSRGFSFYTSDNLIDWEYKSHINGFFECPDLVQVQVSNRPEEIKWILFNGDGSYVTGDFDGERFTPESEMIKGNYGRNFYASRTWYNIPESDGRIIQIAWMKGGEYPDMPFKGQMSFPTELVLTKFGSEYRVMHKPIREIELLYDKHYHWEGKRVIPGINKNLVKRVKGDCLHIKGEFNINNCNSFGFIIGRDKKGVGAEIFYDVQRETISLSGSYAYLPVVDNMITLEILADRSSIEVFGNDGRALLTNYHLHTPGADQLVLFNNGDEIEIKSLDIYKLRSVWREKK